MAEEQRQWQQAREYFLKALAIYIEYQDNYTLGIVVRSLAQLWRASGDAGLPAAVAAIVGGTAAEAEAQLGGMVEGSGRVSDERSFTLAQ